MDVAVTGASGFVGQHVVRHLAARGHAVRGLTRTPAGAARVEAAGARPVRGDVTRPATLGALVEGADAVVHLVGILREGAGAAFDEVLRLGTLHVVQAAGAAGARRLVHQSVLGAADDPAHPFLWAKWRAEEEVRGSGLDWTILRPAMLYGEGDHVATLLAQLAREQPFMPVLAPPDVPLQPLHVQDLARIVGLCLERPSTLGHTYDLGGPEHVRHEDFLDMVMEASGARRPKLRFPTAMVDAMARGMELVMQHPALTHGELHTMLQGAHVTSTGSVREHFGFEPVRLREGLAWLGRAHRPPDVGLGPPPGAGAPPGTPHGKEPRSPA